MKRDVASSRAQAEEARIGGRRRHRSRRKRRAHTPSCAAHRQGWWGPEDAEEESKDLPVPQNEETRPALEPDGLNLTGQSGVHDEVQRTLAGLVGSAECSLD
jgi:hypothetical protein